jgi:hypothetical protein
MDDTILGLFAIVLLAILIAVVFLANKKLNLDNERQYNSYKLAKSRINKASNQKKDDDISDEVEDFIESMPKWLLSVLDGAGVDIEKLYNEDAAELQKVKNLLEKMPLSSHQAEVAKDLVG